MSRPKLEKEALKVKLSITLSSFIERELRKATNNKSEFIETLLKKHFKISK
jgi:hypothetical protein